MTHNDSIQGQASVYDPLRGITWEWDEYHSSDRLCHVRLGEQHKIIHKHDGYRSVPHIPSSWIGHYYFQVDDDPTQYRSFEVAVTVAFPRDDCDFVQCGYLAYPSMLVPQNEKARQWIQNCETGKRLDGGLLLMKAGLRARLDLLTSLVAQGFKIKPGPEIQNGRAGQIFGKFWN